MLRTLGYRYVLSRFQTFWILQIMIITIATTVVAQEPCEENQQYPIDSPCTTQSDCPNAYQCKDGACCMYSLPCNNPLKENDGITIAECKMEKNRPCPKKYICNSDDMGRFTVCCPENDRPDPKDETCTYNGKTYNNGDTFKMEDKCNKCKCKAKGKLSCTDKRSCKKCKINGKTYKKGQQYLKGCEECTCISPKVQRCAKRECKICEYNDKQYSEGEEFKADDKCNTCTCTNGEVNCEDKAMCRKCKIDGEVYKRGETYMVGCNECTCVSPKIQTCEKKECKPSTPATTTEPTTTTEKPTTTTKKPITTTAPPKRLIETCGKSSRLSSRRKKRIIDGTEIVRDSHPWMALIMETRATRPPQTVYCGGALIHPSWIMTSRACVSEWQNHLNFQSTGRGKTFLNNIDIRLGRYNLSLRTEPDEVKAVPLQVIFHPNNSYDDILYWPIYNIALIKIRPVTITDKIQPACISNIDLEPKLSRFSDKRCFFAGWGTKGPTDRYVMLQSPMELESKKSCADYVLEVEPELAYLAAKEIHLCAKATDGSLPAEDDGGGPLVCETDGIWDLQGIGSWNPIPSQGRAIVARTYKIYEWIVSTIEYN